MPAPRSARPKPRPTRYVARIVAAALMATATLTGPALATPVATPPAPPPTVPKHRHTPPAHDRTSPLEARRVDRVTAPKLLWYTCGGLRCATARLPLDYDHPNGPTTELALMKLPARHPSQKVGTLFVNPGGPGASATELVSDATGFLDDAILDSFDIVGVDPRGVGYSDQVHCFTSARTQSPSMTVIDGTPFPYGAAQEKAYLTASRRVAHGCSTTGTPLSRSMSTAEVARDMDVLRRSVGDRKLNYLGFSYGTYLGEVYANLFPDRVRTMVLDGTIDPVAWVGRGSSQLLDQRLGSAAGSWLALREILRRCDRVGPRYCAFAAGDPIKNLAALAERVKKKPLVEADPFSGESYTVHYADLVANIDQLLYSPTAPDDVTQVLADTSALAASADRAAATGRPVPATAALQAARARLGSTLRTLRQATRGSARHGFPYDNSLDAYDGVICTDADHPADQNAWVRAGAADDRRTPYFGRLWDWASVGCARSSWTVADEDAYRGPFTKRPSASVLVVGTRWDPATNYTGAVAAAKVMPTARLLSADNWGHTSYGYSSCVSDRVDRYLLTRRLPAPGLVCHSAYRPFSQQIDSGARRAETARSSSGIRLTPWQQILLAANGPV